MTFPALANDGSVVNLLTGAELSGLLQTIGNNAIAPATQPISGTVSVAGTVPVSGSFYPSTQPVSIAAPVSVTGTVAVTGVATSAFQTTGNGYLQSIVAAVQDTTPAAVTQSGTWSVNLGTLNGAATEATLAALSAKQPTLGQKAAGGSVSFIESSGTTLALAANQVTMQATLDATYAMNTAGYSLTGGTYAAPTGVTIAAGAAGPTTVTLPRSGYYALDVSFTGTSPSLKVQILGVDGTWLDVVTRTVSGAASDPIQFPAGAQIRLFNASAGSLTAVKGRVS